MVGSRQGELIGGLIGIKGVGPKMSEDIINRRDLNQPLTPRQNNLLNSGETPYDDIFECERRFGHIKRKNQPQKHNIKTAITDIKQTLKLIILGRVCCFW